MDIFNPLSANFTKWSNTLKQFVGKLPRNCLSVFDHFMGLALKGLTKWTRSNIFLLQCKKSEQKKEFYFCFPLLKRGIFLRAVRSHPTHPFSYATVRTSMFALVLIFKKSNPLVTGVH